MAPNPANPAPNSAKVPGSGTEVVFAENPVKTAGWASPIKLGAVTGPLYAASRVVANRDRKSVV